MKEKLLQLGTLSAVLCALSMISMVFLGRTATKAADALLAPWFSMCSAMTPDSWGTRGNIILGLMWMTFGLVAYSVLISVVIVVVWAFINKVMRATGNGGNPGHAKIGVAKCLVGAGVVAIAIPSAQAATTIDAVYFAQTHVHKTTDTYFYLVGDRDVLIKAHVVDPATPAAPAVTAVLTLDGQTTTLTLNGPATLPASIADGPGVVQHAFTNSFTATIPKAWVKPGLSVSVRTGALQSNFNNLKIGAPTKFIVQMFDVHWWANSDPGDYGSGWSSEFEAKLPVSDMILRRVRDVDFPELVTDPINGQRPPYRCKSKADYEAQEGNNFDGEQDTCKKWVAALRDAGGGARLGMYGLAIYGVPTGGGEGGGFTFVSGGESTGTLWHEWGHSLSLPHWGDNGAYPYKGDMFGIPAPDVYNGTHAGPVWAFDPILQKFIPPTKDGAYRNDPMTGGGTGRQPSGYLVNHFSDYSVNKMRLYLEGQVLVWNSNLNKYASWNQTAGDYTSGQVTSNGVNYPIERDVSVISLMVAVCGSKPSVNMAYQPTPAYIGNLIRRFDPSVASDRTAAANTYAPSGGIDFCLRVTQGGVVRTYMVPVSNDPNADPESDGALQTKAVNVPAADGAVTKVELLNTPNAQVNGLPANPQVLYTWPASLIDTPTALTAVASTGAVDLDWNASPDATSYKIKRSTVSGGPYSTIRTQAGTSYTDSTVVNDTAYYYVVTAVNSYGESFNSNEASATPPPIYYWDNNGSTAGFGTAAGIWAAPTTGNATQGWSTSATGSTVPGSVTTSRFADLNFGLTTSGLAGGTITVNGTVAANSLKFANGSGLIVLSGGTIDLDDTATITVLNTSDTIQSVIAGAASSLTKAGWGKLTISGANTYTGSTTVSAGKLALGANNTLPDSTTILLDDASLDAATFTDTIGTLNVNGTATINFDSGAALAFASSRALDWNDGTLTLTGNFVSGVSLRFGTNINGLTPAQLSRISGFGFSSFALDSSGYLIVTQATTITRTFSVSATPVGSSTDSDFNITGGSPNTLVDGDTLAAGGSGTVSSIRRTFIQFNLSSLLDHNTVTSAKLRLWRTVNASTNGNAVVYRRTAAFVPGGASDYDELVGDMASASFASGGNTAEGWVEVDVTSIVSSWQTGNLANHFGFAIRGAEDLASSFKNFNSRNAGSNAPQLVVIQHDAAATLPTLSSLSPADDATVVTANANLVATFSENITIGTGNITIKNLTDNTQTTIDITSGSPQITVSGATLTINPSADLLIGKNYAIQIAATAIKDLADNPFAGISDDTTWNFATVAPIPPAIVTLNPTDDAASVGTTSNLVVTFSEDIAIGTGDITIKNLTDTTQTTIDITSGSPQITVSGATLTINPPSNLAGGRDYAIQIAATAIKDLTNNPFAGISDDTTWSFTTLNQNIFTAADDAHMSQVGGITTTNSTLLQAGSDNTNPTFTEFDQYRGYLDFDMTGLTASGTVTNATVYLYFDPDGDTDYGISTLQALSAAYSNSLSK